MAGEALRSALATALSDSPEPEATVSTEGTENEESTPDASDGGQPEGTADEAGTEPEAPQEGTGEPAPDQYFGLDLTGVEPEQRTAILAELRKRDDYIGKLLREPEAPEAPANVEPEESVTEVSDEDILAAFNVDPESNPWAEEMARIVVPLARQSLNQQAALETLIERAELAELDSTWRSSLSSLEKEHGALPPQISHDRVMEFAAENDISNPADAYWRIAGPGRAAVSRSLEAEQARAAKLRDAKRNASTTRPGATQVEDDLNLQAKTTKDATKEAARKLFAKLGYDQ